MQTDKNTPRSVTRARGKVDARQADQHKNTRTVQSGRGRFVPGREWTVSEVESAVAVADAHQLVAALDRHPDATSPACHCPQCGALRSVTALGRWHVACEGCGMLASWLSLRQPCALSVEACLRLAAIVHGIRSEVAA